MIGYFAWLLAWMFRPGIFSGHFHVWAGLNVLESLPAVGETGERRKALRRARAQLADLMRPYVAEASRLARQFERITSPESLAAMTAPHDTQSILLQRMEDSNVRQLWRLTQALTSLGQGALNQKNIKNEDRSEEVVENKGLRDISTE